MLQNLFADDQCRRCVHDYGIGQAVINSIFEIDDALTNTIITLSGRLLT